MLKLFYFTLISSVFCHDIYRFNRDFIKPKPILKKVNANVINCQDGQTQCDDEQTCCPLSNKAYGCCTQPLAVCCSDYLHCCPHGTVCNLNNGTCDNAENIVLSTLKFKVSAFRKKSIVCADSKSQCDDKQTCCSLLDGSTGCCPDLDAVCCSDHVHCCPHNTLCNLNASTCDRYKNTVVSQLRSKVLVSQLKPVICPDGTSECDDGMTCCQQANGIYGCCSYSNATCCSDTIHCCPQDTICNLNIGTCNRKNIVVALLKSKVAANPVGRVICPSTQYQCSDGQTCCELSANTYGCCPYLNATCCLDQVHCCPSSTVCNLKAGTCDRNNNIIVSVLKSKLSTVKTKSVSCPDGQSQCDNGYTCCVLSDSSFGCCPGVNSVCCQDKMHCCPEHTTCNTTNGSCSGYKNHFVSLNSKVPSVRVKDVTCPDGTSCDDGNTCCPLINRTYSCCLYTNAVCCSDHSHCCPSGTTCNRNSKTCDNDIFPFKFHGRILRP